MGVLYGVGNNLVSRNELTEAAAVGSLRSFAESMGQGIGGSIQIGGRRVSSSEFEPDAIEFEPIGMNKPLTVELMSAYTGDAPGRSWFDRIVGRSKPDLLIVSGAKTPTTFGAAPRAINQVVEDIDDGQLYRPGALRDGSAIIYHSPAITDPTTYVSVEMVVDSFSGDVFKQLAGLFSAAAGLPVFAPAAAYLLGGASLAKIGGKLAEAFSESGAFLKADEDIRLDSAGFPVELARFLVFAADSDLPKLAAYGPRVIGGDTDPRVALVHKQKGEEYSGVVPYVIASLDGRKREGEKYAEFAPQHATAAMLEQFYGTDALTGVAGALKDSLKLYNDLHFRKAADKLKKSLEGLKKGSPEYKKLEERLNAYKANIRTEELKAGV